MSEIKYRTSTYPYRVYTALLTQNGGDNPQTITSGSLTIGVTYEITNIMAGDDFTNVGAPLNDTGVKFVATGENPAVWDNSSELSYNEGAPVVTVLENTLEQTPFWEYDSEGYYKFSNISFDSNKLFIVHSFENTNGTSLLNAYAYYDSSNIFWVETGRLIVSGSNVVMSYQDNIINPSILSGTQLYLEIRVYN